MLVRLRCARDVFNISQLSAKYVTARHSTLKPAKIAPLNKCKLLFHLEPMPPTSPQLLTSCTDVNYSLVKANRPLTMTYYVLFGAEYITLFCLSLCSRLFVPLFFPVGFLVALLLLFMCVSSVNPPLDSSY